MAASKAPLLHVVTVGAQVAQVHQHPQLAEPAFLAAAVARYERFWLPLLAAHAGGDGGAAAQMPSNSGTTAGGRESGAASTPPQESGSGKAYAGPLAAPLDVAWVWMAHAIAPVAYRKVSAQHQGPSLCNRLDCRSSVAARLNTPPQPPDVRQGMAGQCARLDASMEHSHTSALQGGPPCAVDQCELPRSLRQLRTWCACSAPLVVTSAAAGVSHKTIDMHTPASQDVEAALGLEAAARLWSCANAVASAPHTRPGTALAATQALWEAAFPGEPFHPSGLGPPGAASPLRQPLADGPAGSGLAPPAHTEGVSAAVAEPAAEALGQRGGGGAGDGEGAGDRAGGELADGGPASAFAYDVVAAGVRQFEFYWSVRPCRRRLPDLHQSCSHIVQCHVLSAGYVYSGRVGECGGPGIVCAASTIPQSFQEAFPMYIST